MLNMGCVLFKDKASSLSIDEDVVVVGGDAPVLAVVILLRVVFLVVGEEGVQLDALLEVLDGLQTTDVFGEVEVTVGVDACADEAMPVDTLKFHVGMVLLEGEVERLAEVDVGAFDGVHVLARHLELVEVEVFGEDLHLL